MVSVPNRGAVRSRGIRAGVATGQRDDLARRARRERSDDILALAAKGVVDVVFERGAASAVSHRRDQARIDLAEIRQTIVIHPDLHRVLCADREIFQRQRNPGRTRRVGEGTVIVVSGAQQRLVAGREAAERGGGPAEALVGADGRTVAGDQGVAIGERGRGGGIRRAHKRHSV